MADNNTPTNGRSNGGIIGGVTKVAEKTVGALTGFPMLLVLTLLNIASFAMITYLFVKSAEYRFAERQEIVKLLTQCVEDARRRGGANYKTPGWIDKDTQKAAGSGSILRINP